MQRSSRVVHGLAAAHFVGWRGGGITYRRLILLAEQIQQIVLDPRVERGVLLDTLPRIELVLIRIVDPALSAVCSLLNACGLHRHRATHLASVPSMNARQRDSSSTNLGPLLGPAGPAAAAPGGAAWYSPSSHSAMDMMGGQGCGNESDKECRVCSRSRVYSRATRS